MEPDVAVLTLNCQFAFRETALHDFLLVQVRAGKYDFILLQEVGDTVREMLRNMKVGEHGYELLLTHNTAIDETATTCILYRRTFHLCGTRYLSFQPQVRYRSHNGITLGIFRKPKSASLPTERIVICSAHLHDRERLFARRREIKQLKELFAELDPKREMMTVIGGDFNNMFFRELHSITGRMMPEFVRHTVYEPHSHDTTHLEDTPRHSKIVARLGRFGLRLRTKIDHIFIDAPSAAQFTWESHVLDVFVSDHRPVELLGRKS